MRAAPERPGPWASRAWAETVEAFSRPLVSRAIPGCRETAAESAAAVAAGAWAGPSLSPVSGRATRWAVAAEEEGEQAAAAVAAKGAPAAGVHWP